MSGWGNTLARADNCRRDSLSREQLEKWVTYTYYQFPRAELPRRYVADTVRCDFYHGAYIVSACRRGRLVRILELWFPGVCFWGRRELLEIHVGG